MPAGRVNSGRDSAGPVTDIVVVGGGPPCAKAETAPVAPKATAAANSRVARTSIAIAASPANTVPQSDPVLQFVSDLTHQVHLLICMPSLFGGG